MRCTKTTVQIFQLDCVRNSVAEVMEVPLGAEGLDLEEELRRKMAMWTLCHDQGNYDRALLLMKE